jgi:hypothetical protein
MFGIANPATASDEQCGERKQDGVWQYVTRHGPHRSIGLPERRSHAAIGHVAEEGQILLSHRSVEVERATKLGLFFGACLVP